MLRLVAVGDSCNFLRGGWVCSVMRMEGRDFINGDAFDMT